MPIIPSEYSPSGFQIVPVPDRHRDPTPEEIAERRRANRIKVEDVEKMLSPQAFAFLRDAGMLGAVEKDTNMDPFRPWRRPTTDYLQRDVVEAGIQRIRVVAAGLPKR